MRPAAPTLKIDIGKEPVSKSLGDGQCNDPEMSRSSTIAENCTHCGLCLTECQFLRSYGTPGALASTRNPSDRRQQAIAFECSLCGLCNAVCPSGLNPAGMFLQWRREAVENGGGNYPEHSPILAYEKRGTSQRYTWYGFPRNCDNVLFPGCTLSGTRPESVKTLYRRLAETVPDLGVVLDCCSKPSHDLGRENHFQAMFGEMKEYLLANGIRNILVACPNCYKVFKTYGKEFEVSTVYEVLAGRSTSFSRTCVQTVSIHDPCAVRFDAPLHKAVRDLVECTGLVIREMPHHGEKTFCCGEGGSVGFLAPDLAANWRSLRKEEAGEHRMVTYCAGCANHLGKTSPTSHILDLLFHPEATLAGKESVSAPPITYWNRLRLKQWFRKHLDSAVTRERTFSADERTAKTGIARDDPAYNRDLSPIPAYLEAALDPERTRPKSSLKLRPSRSGMPRLIPRVTNPFYQFTFSVEFERVMV